METFFRSLLIILNEMSPYILLGFLLAGVLHVYVRPSLMVRHLSGNGIGPVLKAALFGIPLPLCSCGVLPTAVALRRGGASKGAATSFLIATPQTGVDSIAATWSLLGPAFAIIRPVAALAGAVAGGWAVSRTDKDAPAGECSLSAAELAEDRHIKAMPWWKKMAEAVRYGLVDMVASVGKWLVIGLVVAAMITVLEPDELFLSLNRYPLPAMLVMILVAVPMYVCATGSIPIAMSLMLKGMSPGVAFVLLMAGPAANFASVMILGKAMGRRATAVYIGSVAVTAIVFGLAIDYLMPQGLFALPAGVASMGCCHEAAHLSLFPTLCSILLAGLLAYTALAHKPHHHNHSHNIDLEMKQTVEISGMSCSHCQATVRKALSAIAGAKNVEVDLSSGIATLEGDVPHELIRKAIEEAGFDVKGFK